MRRDSISRKAAFLSDGVFLVDQFHIETWSELLLY